MMKFDYFETLNSI